MSDKSIVISGDDIASKSSGAITIDASEISQEAPYRPKGFESLKAVVGQYPKATTEKPEPLVKGVLSRLGLSEQPITDLVQGISYASKHPLDAADLVLSAANAPQLEAFRRARGAIKSGEYGYAGSEVLEGAIPIAGPIIGGAARELGGGKTRSAILDLYVPALATVVGHYSPAIADIIGEKSAALSRAVGSISKTGATRIAMEENVPIQEAMGTIKGPTPEGVSVGEAARKSARAEISLGRRVAAKETQRIAEVAAPGGPVEPIEAARSTMRALQTQAGAQRAVESRLYTKMYDDAKAQGVKVSPTNTAKASSDVFHQAAPAQQAFGASSLSPSDITGVGKIARATSVEESVRQRFEQLQTELPSEMRMRMTGAELSPAQMEVFSKALGGGPTEIPFQQFDEAQRGLGKVIRTLQASGNPENATRIRALSQLQNAMKKDIQESLSQHPDISSAYDQAHKLTIERHSAIDVNTIRDYFKSPRSRPAAEKIVEMVLSPGTSKVGSFKEIQDVARGVTIGPETLRAAEIVGGPEVAEKLRKSVANDAIAMRGLRRAVIDSAVRAGTKESSIAGIAEPELDYSAMAEYLRARPGAKILLGNDYGKALDSFRRLAKINLMHSDPAYASFLKSVAERMSEDQIISKAASDVDFARRVSRLARNNPEFKQRVADSVFQQIYNNSMMFGQFGEANSYFSMQSFAREFRKAEPSLKLLADPQAVSDLRSFADTTEKINRLERSAHRPMAIRMFQRLIHLGEGGHLYLSMPMGGGEYLITPKDLARAASDPRVAALLNVAASTPIDGMGAAGLAAAIAGRLQQDSGGQSSSPSLPPMPSSEAFPQ